MTWIAECDRVNKRGRNADWVPVQAGIRGTKQLEGDSNRDQAVRLIDELDRQGCAPRIAALAAHLLLPVLGSIDRAEDPELTWAHRRARLPRDLQGPARRRSYEIAGDSEV